MKGTKSKKVQPVSGSGKKAGKVASKERSRSKGASKRSAKKRKKPKKKKYRLFADMVEHELDGDDSPSDDSSGGGKSSGSSEEIREFRPSVFDEDKFDMLDSTKVDIAQLRRRRKALREKYWDRILQIVQEYEKFKAYEDKGGAAARGEPEDKSTGVDGSHSGNLSAWLKKATATLPSNAGEGPVFGQLLQGTSYRIFKRAGNLLYAKYTFTDENDEEYNDADHLKEAGGPEMSDYRKNFDYLEHLENIRAFPTTLKKKKKMLKYLNSEADLFRRLKSHAQDRQCIADFQACWVRTKEFMSRLASFELWKLTIQNMYGHFGNEVLLCYQWYRKLFVLQIMYLITAQVFRNVLLVAWIRLFLLYIPELVQYKTNPVCTVRTGCQFSPLDLLTGRGWFHQSLFYYGGYSPDLNQGLHWFEVGSCRFVTFWFMIVFCNGVLLLVVLRLNKSSQYRLHKGKDTLVYFHEVFCAWDFSMNSIQLAKNVQESIAKKLAFLNSHIQQHGVKTVDFDYKSSKRWRFIAKVFATGSSGLKKFNRAVNVFTLIIALITAFCLWNILTLQIHYRNEVTLCFLPGLFMSLMFNAVSPLITLISDMTMWNTKLSRNYAILFRLTLIYAVNYFVLVIWLLRLSYFQHDLATRDLCVETIIGEIVYCIFLWEFIFSSLYWLVWELGIMHYHFRLKRQNYKAPQPKIEGFFMSTVFMQSVLCMTVQFAPLMPLMCILINVLKFYIRTGIYLRVYTHPRVYVQKSDCEMPYFVAFYIFFILSTFAGLHFFSTGVPSSVCGPFSMFSRNSILPAAATYKEGLLYFLERTQEGSVVWGVILNPAVGFILVFLILGGVYIVKYWGDSYITTLEVYNGLFQLERQDRNILLRAIYDLTQTQTDGGANAQDDNDTLVLDKNNIYKAKIRFLASMIVGGRRYVLSKKYKKLRKQAKEQEKGVEVEPDEDLEDRTPGKETIAARRESLAQKFLLHTEAIKLAHASARKERQQKWVATDGAAEVDPTNNQNNV